MVITLAAVGFHVRYRTPILWGNFLGRHCFHLRIQDKDLVLVDPPRNTKLTDVSFGTLVSLEYALSVTTAHAFTGHCLGFLNIGFAMFSVSFDCASADCLLATYQV